MRLWTLHPKYLDVKGLVAAWREALLAQKVLQGGTRGYTNHSQLARFRAHKKPVEAIATFLAGIAEEADQRGYHFDHSKISGKRLTTQVAETDGQLLFEWSHLRAKLQVRAPDLYRQSRAIKIPDPHPMFRIVEGDVREWERREPGQR